MQNQDQLSKLQEQLNQCTKQISIFGKTINQKDDDTQENQQDIDDYYPDDMESSYDRQTQDDFDILYGNQQHEEDIIQQNQQYKLQESIKTQIPSPTQIQQVNRGFLKQRGFIYISDFIQQCYNDPEYVRAYTLEAIALAQNQYQPRTLIFDIDVTYEDSITIYGSLNIQTLPSAVVKFKSGGFVFQAEKKYKYMKFSKIGNQHKGSRIEGTIITGLTAGYVKFFNKDHGMKRGDVVKLCSEDKYNWIKLQARAGECAVVVQVDNETVWFDREFDRNVNYTKLYKYSEEAKLNIQLNVENHEDLQIGGSLVIVNNYLNAQIKVQCFHSTYQCLTMGGNFKANVEVRIENIRNFNDQRTKWGYGIVDQNNESCKYQIDVKNIRHGYTTTFGGGSQSPNAYGQAKDNIVTGVGIECITPFDTHASGENIRFENCYSYYSYGAGFANRSNNTVFINCFSIGTSDSGFQNYDEEKADDIEYSHNKKCTLINCSSRGHKRGIKSHYRFGNKDSPNYRFNLELINCTFECQTNRELIYVRNTDLSYKNLVLRQLSHVGSRNHGIARSGVFIAKSFISVINSNVSGDAKFVADEYARYIYPFSVQVIRTEGNPGSEVRIHQSRLELDDSKWRNGLCFGQIFVSRALIDWPLKENIPDNLWVKDIDHFYFQADEVVLHNKGQNSLLDQNVQDYMTERQIHMTRFYKITTNKLWAY